MGEPWFDFQLKTEENDIPDWFGACKNFRWILVLEKLQEQSTGKSSYLQFNFDIFGIQIFEISGSRDLDFCVFRDMYLSTLKFLSFFPRRISSQILSIHPTSKGPSKFPLQRYWPWKIDRFWLKMLKQNDRFFPSSKSEILNLWTFKAVVYLPRLSTYPKSYVINGRSPMHDAKRKHCRI